MKYFYSLCLAMILSFQTNAQLVISEIMYNPPEAGEDSLEYIEILNNGNSPVNLQGVSIEGVTHKFPPHIIAPGASYLLAKDSVAMKIVFNVSAFQWNAGALSNGGEKISLRDTINNTLFDELTYDDALPWPVDGAAQGASIVLCNPNADNSLGASWSAAKNAIGVTINGKELRGSPGVGNSVSCDNSAGVVIEVSNYKFTPKDITIDPGTIVRWINQGGDHNVNGQTSVYPDNPESFTNGPVSTSLWTYDFTFTKPGLYKYQCDPHADFGMVGSITVKSNEKVYPKYPITLVTTVNSNGLVDSLNKICELTGIVHGGNLRPAGLQFTIIDGQNNGIGVFNTNSNLGYNVKEGDEVSIKGTINQFNGFTQIVADVIAEVGSKNALSPKIITSFAEEDESSLVQLKNLNFVDIAEWKGDGSNFNVNVTDGTSTFQMRIDADTDLSTLPAPKAPFNITGLLGQFDSSSPYTEGYQLLPRYAADIATISATSDNDIYNLSFSPNPVLDKVEFLSDQQITSVEINTITGIKVVVNAGNTADLSDLKSGYYLAKVNFASGSKIVKLVKK